MNQLYVGIVIISSLSLLTMKVGIEDNHFIPPEKRRGFQTVFGLLIVLNWAEWLAAVLNGDAGQSITLHWFAKAFELTVTPFLPVMAIRILGTVKMERKLYIPAIFNVILQIASIFTGAVFRIGAGNVYARGPLYALYVLSFVVGCAVLAVACLRFSKKYQYRNVLFLVLIMGMVVLATLLPLLAPSLRLDWSCISFAMIIFYVYYIQLAQQVDSLTALLNRQTYDYSLKMIDRETIIVFTDIDRFKIINDTFGHGFGDYCLAAIAAELKAVFEKKGYCYRFGGDEFCVIMKHRDAPIEHLLAQFSARVAALRAQDSRITDVSVGFARFDPSTETIDAAVNRADEMMYENKKTHAAYAD